MGSTDVAEFVASASVAIRLARSFDLRLQIAGPGVDQASESIMELLFHALARIRTET